MFISARDGEFDRGASTISFATQSAQHENVIYAFTYAASIHLENGGKYAALSSMNDGGNRSAVKNDDLKKRMIGGFGSSLGSSLLLGQLGDYQHLLIISHDKKFQILS